MHAESGLILRLRLAGFDPLPDIDFHAQTRYTEVTLGVQSDRGEPERWSEKSVLRSLNGAITCAAAGNFASPAFSEAATPAWSSSAGPMGRNGGELRPPVTRVAKPHKLRAARPSRCED